MGAMPTREQILEALKAVIDPELRRDIVELEMVRSIDDQGRRRRRRHGVADDPRLPDQEPLPDRRRRGRARRSRASRASTSASTCSPTGEGRRCSASSAGPAGCPRARSPRSPNVICVGSGKGGVGKSSLTVNLAAALAAEGKKVGVLDADVWGYSIPRMLGLGAERPKVSGERKILPLEAHGIKVMSIGFFIDEDEAVVWRGPMLHKALTQFLEDVDWGELDYLLIDLPPGTGDVSMTLAQLLPQAKFVIVTTPQPTAQKVARRSARDGRQGQARDRAA